MAIHFVYERGTTMHKILHILSTAIHFVSGLRVEHNAYHAHIHASLCTGEKRKDLMALQDVFKIMKSVKLNHGYGA